MVLRNSLPYSIRIPSKARSPWHFVMEFHEVLPDVFSSCDFYLGNRARFIDSVFAFFLASRLETKGDFLLPGGHSWQCFSRYIGRFPCMALHTDRILPRFHVFDGFCRFPSRIFSSIITISLRIFGMLILLLQRGWLAVIDEWKGFRKHNDVLLELFEVFADALLREVHVLPDLFARHRWLDQNAHMFHRDFRVVLDRLSTDATLKYLQVGRKQALDPPSCVSVLHVGLQLRLDNAVKRLCRRSLVRLLGLPL